MEPRPDVPGIREMLDGLQYPAQRWQVIAQAQHWGADPGSVDELCRLGPDSFRSVEEVAAALAQQRDQDRRRRSAT